MQTGDLGTLWRLVRGIPPAGSHAESLQRFYAPQAAHYDRFREQLLQGRAELLGQLEFPAGARVVELGAGTGRNVDYYADRLASLSEVLLVDLCPALLAQARVRTRRWPRVRVIEADAAKYTPTGAIDCVYLSYALTMMPEWRNVLDNALAMLRTGGTLGVVDFYVAAAAPPADQRRHSWWTRHFWPWWFRHDGVRLSPEHLPALRARLRTCYLREGLASIPYVPGLRVPYYVLVGRA